MFKKILIANRGAIATRIIRTLNKMDVESVAVYSAADEESLHVRHATHAYSLGEGPAAGTYLNQDKIIEIALKSGAEAIHPGYGFLSENPDFVQRCEKENLVFIGPGSQHMLDFGLKHRARDLAKLNGVPLLPGTDLLNTQEEACAAALEIGFPVMLKSTAGGGGIGMQICRDEREIELAFSSVKHLSANNFSNDGVFIEKYIEHARHIEVQVFGDGKGKAVAFGERDCSAQRRHQKVIEETPAPNIPDSVSVELQDAATKLLAAVNYQNAGTVEYIYDQQSNTFYFLEVNTRLQVEHGVTEQVFGIDLVEWMVKQAAGELGDIKTLRQNYSEKGHAVQVRIYAENPHKDFQPSAGLLSCVEFPQENKNKIRIDSWIETGLEVSSFFDPMLAKVICWAETREQANMNLAETLLNTRIQGVETNIAYLQKVIYAEEFAEGKIFTRFLNTFRYQPTSVDVLSSGTMTTIQDYPGRTGYWDVGVPPSGPFDSLSFRLGNRILGNAESAAGLEITLRGPTLVFNSCTAFVLTGAIFEAQLDGEAIEFFRIYKVEPGQKLEVKQVIGAGARAYLCVAGGFDGNLYLGSKSTFTLGQFGGFSGRALRTGDVLHLSCEQSNSSEEFLPVQFPQMQSTWQIRVIYGPHGAPDFFTDSDIETFFTATWEVHYNSSRTGVRLIGPKPDWARESGGEAGMHPSNIHDNAYAIGTIDFTGDMPVILGPDGPSLGGFVCPATVITADLWKLGQLKAGDKIQFVPVAIEQAKVAEEKQFTLESESSINTGDEVSESFSLADIGSPIVDCLGENENGVAVSYRVAGDKYLLVEYGPMELDISLRFRVHALMTLLKEEKHSGLSELTPGIRSLQVHYNNHILPLPELVNLLKNVEQRLANIHELTVPARVVHIPLSWNDDACKLAVEKYMQSVRKDAPWCPDNIEFIRRINGLNSIDDVKKIVFDASYVVMGLGDVYLGAPVATPLDPRHRLVTTKYNPARTWTAENSVGIGGSYLCVYGMEGPGGYQFVGRTLQMWNKYRQTKEFSQPWLLRFFDQIRFYEVDAEELVEIRKQFPLGRYPLKIEETTFSLNDYQTFLQEHNTSINEFVGVREKAFAQELLRWKESGQINFSIDIPEVETLDDHNLEPNSVAIESHVAGNIWKWQVEEGESVQEGQVVCILESMKMEIEVLASCAGILMKKNKVEGQQTAAGQTLGVIKYES